MCFLKCSFLKKIPPLPEDCDILAQAERDLEADLFLLARELLVPRHGFSPILACFVRYSWTYDTERVKHVIGLMGAPFFFHLSYGTYGTLSYSKSVELGGIKLQRDKAVFRNSR
jgi:hypothetical protein